MTRIIVRYIVWDAFNVEHIKKHNVNQQEIQVSIRNIAYHKKAHSGRYLMVGRTDKRIITVVLRRLQPKTYYLVTARDANKKERRDVYEKEDKSEKK